MLYTINLTVYLSFLFYIKNEDDDDAYYDGNTIKSDPDWSIDEGGSSRMVGHNIGVKSTNDKDSDLKRTAMNLKQRLKNKRLKKRHKKEVDFSKIDEPFYCCEMKFEKKVSLKKHKIEAHNTEESDSEDKDHPCKVCGLVYDNKTDYTAHLEKQHGVGKANACPLCLVVLEDRAKRYYLVRIKSSYLSRS